MDISLLGLGKMGFALATHLVEGKHKVTVWNRDQKKAEEFLSKNPSSLSKQTAKECILASNLTFIVLWDYQSILNTVFDQLEEGDFQGRTFINICTIGPEESIELANRVIKFGGKWIESPVLGNNKMAEAKKLQLLTAGIKEECESIAPLLELFGLPRYLGKYGTGSATKLALNAFLATYVTAFSSSHAYLEACGADIDIFSTILQAGPFNAAGGYYGRWTNSFKTKNFEDDVAFSVGGIAKDCNLVVDELKRHNVDASIFEGANVLIQKSVASGNSNLDMAAVYLESNTKK
jgi:3-hydroxyisobutyrate dehydrogenase